MHDTSTPYPLHEELREAGAASESDEGGQLLDELVAQALAVLDLDALLLNRWAPRPVA